MTHGQFAFTTHEAGNYLACFWIEGHYQGSGYLSVNLDWKTGIAAKDWESVARKEKIEVSTPMSNSLVSLNLETCKDMKKRQERPEKYQVNTEAP